MIAALVTFFSGGCRLGDLSFKEDERVDIVAPGDRDKVSLPFDVRWTVEGFEVVGADGSDRKDAGYFAVLLDTTPMPPGADLEYFARDDTSCVRTPGCPDRQYLADRNIYVTEEASFRVETLADTRPTDRPGAVDDHEITIVLLNGRSQRIGEGAFRVKVIVDRGQG